VEAVLIFTLMAEMAEVAVGAGTELLTMGVVRPRDKGMQVVWVAALRLTIIVLVVVVVLEVLAAMVAMGVTGGWERTRQYLDQA
jgi:hypothetical protein